MTDKERAQAYLKLADKATVGEWYVSQGNVVSRDSYKIIALRGLQKEDTEFIAASRTEGVYFAREWLDAQAEIERLRKIEKAAIAVVNAESGEDIEDAVGKLESVMNGDWSFNPTEYAEGFLTSEIERLRGAIEKIANWNSVEVDEEGSEAALVNKVMEMRSIARRALGGVSEDV